MEILLDLENICSADEFYDLLGEKLTLPAYFGRNLDALHDVLAECADDTEIVFKNSTKTAPNMRGYVEALRWMCSETTEEYPEIQIEFK